MTTIVGKFLLSDDWNPKHTLLVKVDEDQQINYFLSLTKNRTPVLISMLKLKTALPEVMLDYTSVTQMLNEVAKAIRTGDKKIDDVKNYQLKTA